MTILSQEPVNETNESAISPEATAGERFGAGWTSETVRTDAWSYTERLRENLRRDLIDRLPDEAKGRVYQQYGPAADRETRIEQTLMDEVGLARAANDDDSWGALPRSLEELDAEVLRQRKAALDDAELLLGIDGGGIAGFMGTGTRAMTDQTSLMLVPFGLGGSAARVIAGEAVLGGLGEAAVLPREFEVAEELDIEKPNSIQRILTGTILGGSFAGVLTGGARILQYGAAKRAGTQQSRPDGTGAPDFDDDVNAEVERLATGVETATADAPRPPAVNDPAAPPNWQRIRNGIFAGESGGDYDAVFGFQNRPGGKFENVRVSEMSVDEALEFSNPRGPYGQWVKSQIGRVATPMGAYQVVGKTLRAAKKGLGLRGDEIMTEELQERIGQWIYRAQGTRAWVGYRGPSDTRPTPGDGSAPAFGGYSTSRAYTGTGQVVVSDDLRIDVDYQVVDAGSLRQASGDLQPRDRARNASDAWIAATAAELDPALLMPSPTADRGTPIVGIDNIIESGNGRVRAIERAYDQHPDRAAAYRQQIEQTTGAPIPEGIEQPVLIARRATELDTETRRQMVVDAQDSGVARMTASERAQVGQRALTADLMAKFVPGRKFAAAENRDFARAFAGSFPRSERNAFIDQDGALSMDGVRQLQDAMFARAYPAPDILARYVETEAGDLRSLMDALSDAAPDIALLRAEIDAGLVRPEMDITGFVLDAARLIMSARDLAAREGGKASTILSELLSEVDMLDGAVAPLTAALVRSMMPKGQQVPAVKITEFLKRYVAEARKAGKSGDMLGDGPGPLDVLQSIDKRAFGDLTEIGTARLDAQLEPAIDMGVIPDGAFADGASSPDAELVDDLIAAGLLENPAPFGRVHEGFDNDPEGAIRKLLADKDGEVTNAVVRDDLGPVALVYGTDNFGLAHIQKKHPEIVERLPDLLRDGKLVHEIPGDRAYLQLPGNPPPSAVIRLNWDGVDKTWLVTAFDDVRGGIARQVRTSDELPASASSQIPDTTGRDKDTPDAPEIQDSTGDAIAQAIADLRAAGDDLDFEMPDGTKISGREMLEGLDEDEVLEAALDACTLGRAG